MAKRKAHDPEIEHLVNIHGETFRRLIKGFIEFSRKYGHGYDLSFPSGRKEAVNDLIFRVSPPDCLEKYKEPRAPDWVLDGQERVRQSNSYIHEIRSLTATVGRLKENNETLALKVGQPVRRRLPDTRRAVTHKFSIGSHKGYMTVGMFEDGMPGELFVSMAKEGSTIGGLMDTVGTLTSLALQYGVSIETLAKKFSHQRFEPSGFTTNDELKTASSVIDYVFRWMELHFIKSRQAAAPEDKRC